MQILAAGARPSAEDPWGPMTSNPERLPPSTPDALPPFPEGWYFVASRESIQREKLIEKTWMGEEIVVWCDDQGELCVADAFCPHLGSHLGPAVGGVVRDGRLVCPFHGFAFDPTGRCVATPHAPAPSAARLKVYPTTEILGLIFAWWTSDARPPEWELPNDPPAGADWSELRSCTLRFRGHPQETTENSVDIEHLGYTHGYHDVEPIGSTFVEGPYLRSSFEFKTVRRIAGLVSLVSEISAVAHVHGLGYSLVEFREKTIGIESRLWVLATPVDGTVVDLTLVSQVRKIRKPGRFFAGFGFLPTALRHRLVNRIVLREERRFVLQDVVIWERKRYQAPPRLSRADGPVGRYRQYSRQFYPELESRPRSALSVV